MCQRIKYLCIFIQTFFNILEVGSVFCLLGIKEFHILHSIYYNSIVTINARNKTCEKLLNLIINISVDVLRF
jgi:hypothetical protein